MRTGIGDLRDFPFAELGVSDALPRRGYAEAIADVSTSSASYVTLGDGPVVTVVGGPTTLAHVFVSADIQGGAPPQGAVGLQLNDGAPLDVLQSGASGWHTLRSVPGSSFGADPATGFGGALVIPIVGRSEFQLVYRAIGGTPHFANRRLWVWTTSA